MKCSNSRQQLVIVEFCIIKYGVDDVDRQLVAGDYFHKSEQSIVCNVSSCTEQVDPLSQRDRAAGWASFGQM